MRASVRFHRVFSVSPLSAAVRRRPWGAGTLALLLLLVGGGFFNPAARAQRPQPLATPTPAARGGGFFLFRQPQKPVTQTIPSQPPAVINQSVLDQVNPDNAHCIVSLSKQRVYLMVGDDIAIDSPISSGRKGHTTPKGSFHVLEKDRNHMSNIYGNYVDRSGRVVRSGISSKIDSAPAGTHYVGAPMLWFMRLTGEGVGMHIGILPGYAASHGCVRLPADIAPQIYAKVKVGTPVTIGD